MLYALLIYGDETWTPLPAAEEAAIMQDYFAFGRDNAEAITGGAQLQDPGATTSVRVRDGERVLTDGPYAETREVLGGFYIVEAPDLDAAIELAAGIPDVVRGWVEVRPVVGHTRAGDAGAEAAG